MEKLFTLEFQLKKPYKEAEGLINVFNQLIVEGGRCEIIIVPISEESNRIEIYLYRGSNSLIAAGMGSRFINTLSEQDKKNITKFNLASTKYNPVKFRIENNNNEQKGPKIFIDLYENKNTDVQTNLNKQFKFLDL